MIIQTFDSLNIGARFRFCSADNIAVYTKTSNEYKIDQHSGYPEPNASSSKFGFIGVRPDVPVLQLSDEEVVLAGRLEDIYRTGKELYNKTFIGDDGLLYVRVKVLERPKPNDSIFT